MLLMALSLFSFVFLVFLLLSPVDRCVELLNRSKVPKFLGKVFSLILPTKTLKFLFRLFISIIIGLVFSLLCIWDKLGSRILEVYLSVVLMITFSLLYVTYKKVRAVCALVVLVGCKKLKYIGMGGVLYTALDAMGGSGAENYVELRRTLICNANMQMDMVAKSLAGYLKPIMTGIQILQQGVDEDA